MINSNLDDLRLVITTRLTTEQVEFFRSQHQNKNTEFYRIFEYLVTNNQVKIEEYQPKNLRDHLRTLKEKLMETLASQKRNALFDELLMIETAFEIGLRNDGLERIEALFKKLDNYDFWIRWRLLDLLFKHLPIDERDKDKRFHLNPLKHLAQCYLSSQAIHLESEEFLEKSPLILWLVKAKEEYEKKYGSETK